MNAKFPRIPHLPFSPGGTTDDLRLTNLEHLLKQTLVVTEKLDGSNVCLTRDEVFARSHSSVPKHSSFDWLKKYHSLIRYSIPEGMSIFCEYLYAVHSIEYPNLPHYLFVIGVRCEILDKSFWTSWVQTRELAGKLDLPTVPVLNGGPYPNPECLYADSEPELSNYLKTKLPVDSKFGGTKEGYVVRKYEAFSDLAFATSIAKWVRADHVQTDEHWSINWKKANINISINLDNLKIGWPQFVGCY